MHSSILSERRQLNISWIVVAGVCSILTLIVAAIGLRYQLSGVEQSNTWKSTFAAGQSNSIIQTAKHWDDGDLMYGVMQTTGTPKTTKYDIWWKKTNGSYNLEFSNGYCNTNDTYYGAWYMHSPNGISQYAYKLVKKTNLNTKSILSVDLMLT